MVGKKCGKVKGWFIQKFRENSGKIWRCWCCWSPHYLADLVVNCANGNCSHGRTPVNPCTFKPEKQPKKENGQDDFTESNVSALLSLEMYPVTSAGKVGRYVRMYVSLYACMYVRKCFEHNKKSFYTHILWPYINIYIYICQVLGSFGWTSPPFSLELRWSGVNGVNELSVVLALAILHK